MQKATVTGKQFQMAHWIAQLELEPPALVICERIERVSRAAARSPPSSELQLPGSRGESEPMRRRIVMYGVIRKRFALA